MNFITTTLPYINSVPHIGHAFEFILGDSLSRFFKSKEKTHFNIGLDEHGLKVWLKSKELNLTPEEHIENLTKTWLEFCEKFQIDYDTFYKTSTIDHHDKVKVIWNRFLNRGDIYKKRYSAKYCIGCESFKTDKELINGLCSDHKTSPEEVEEENYFFRLSKYRESLLYWLDNSPDFLNPNTKKEELRNLIINSDDISISRLKENCPWGIEVPNDSNQIIYVWFDALLNYIFAAGYLTENFNWDNVIQICGPDNLRFQGVIFQAFLEAEGIKKTDKLLVHGTILDESGLKISKSLGNTIDPIEQLNKWGLDAVRYYSLAGLSTFSNSNWVEEDLVNLFNSDVCNDWGNLISRTLHLIDVRKIDINKPTKDFKDFIDSKADIVNKTWTSLKVKDAIQKTNEIVKYGNKLINDEKPWIESTNNNEVLSNLYYLIQIVNELYKPVLPEKSIFIEESLLKKVKVIAFQKI